MSNGSALATHGAGFQLLKPCLLFVQGEGAGDLKRWGPESLLALLLRTLLGPVRLGISLDDVCRCVACVLIIHVQALLAEECQVLLEEVARLSLELLAVLVVRVPVVGRLVVGLLDVVAVALLIVVVVLVEGEALEAVLVVALAFVPVPVAQNGAAHGSEGAG